jgi:hypothetical protein
MAKQLHSHKWLVVLNAISLTIMLTLNTLANALPINGITTGEVSAEYENLFTPAGFAFSIWGIIYLLLLVQLIAMVIKVIKYNTSKIVSKMGRTLPLIHLTNSAWLIAWHYQLIALSWGLIILLLYLLSATYRKSAVLGPGKNEYLYGKLPVRVYLGWVMAATLANTAVLITKWQTESPIIPPTIWAPLFALVLVVITFSLLLYRKDLVITFTVIWALSAIYFGNITRQIAGTEIMRWIALTGIVLLLLGSVYIMIQRLTKIIPPLRNY